MNFRLTAVALSLLAACSLTLAEDGLINLQSPYPVPETMQRLVNQVRIRNLNIANLVDHSAAAASVGLVLNPEQVLIFGNPKAGTPLMQCSQTIGIDLPLKALVWQDDAGQVWLTYNDMKRLAKRHDIKSKDCPAVATIDAALAAIAAATLAP